MSLPLTRRIARAALLVAAGAAAGVGAAGSASAVPSLPSAPNLGLSALDGAPGKTVGNVTRGVEKTAPDATEVAPAAGTTVKKAVPVVKELPTDSLGKSGPTKNLPVKDLPLG
ncbi:ATP-binding protein [Streptomyces sp. SudanB66_2053]|uniref:ATP-binding protein n=1 Tax=Streptomyces sp. SudanB66_2053 TaxID=3035277 RepID=UPI003F55F189